MSWEVCCRNMCRACMKIDGVLLPMYDDDTISSKNLPEKLTELTSIQIDRHDGLPHMLCAKCAYRTVAFYDFKLQVQATEEKLRKMFDTQMEDIKEEIENGNEQDSIMLNNESVEKKFLFDSSEMVSINYTSSINDELNKEIKEGTDEVEQSLEIISFMDLNQSNGTDKIQDHLNKIINVDQQGKLCSIKSELVNQFCSTLSSHDLNCTVVYIGDTIMESIKSEDHDNPCKSKDENISIKVSSCKENFEKPRTNDEFLDTIYISDNTELKSTKTLSIENETWQLVSTDRSVIIEQEDKTKLNDQQDCNTTENVDLRESDDTDSDYFIDPKDNILGSLNDTITRIKEIKTENNTMQYQCTLYTETVLIEQVLLNQDVTQVIPQEEAEKENVDALLNLIHGASHGGGKHARTSPPPPVGASTPPPHLHRHLRRRTQGSWVSTLILHAPISLHSHVHEVARTGLVVVLFHPHTFYILFRDDFASYIHSTRTNLSVQTNRPVLPAHRNTVLIYGSIGNGDFAWSEKEEEGGLAAIDAITPVSNSICPVERLELAARTAAAAATATARAAAVPAIVAVTAPVTALAASIVGEKLLV
ncbi:zinc finger protein 805-like isoform X4 [Vespula squamosa]|uniref:Zinc finger protein 805-like isoform X4 n=1 Tax=Vespula squamosa TaxID=30214 RepID=A0ABD2C661_VESSQ